MASQGLKRPLDYELPCSSASSTSMMPSFAANSSCSNYAAVAGNKRRCTNLVSQQSYKSEYSPFREPSTILAPLNDEIASLIKDEEHKIHQNTCNHSHPDLHALSSGRRYNNEPVIFTARQTQMICERLIKEREKKLREEYEKILITKLAEQYDTFVRYTHDHIEKRYNESNSHQTSYLS